VKLWGEKKAKRVENQSGGRTVTAGRVLFFKKREGQLTTHYPERSNCGKEKEKPKSEDGGGLKREPFLGKWNGDGFIHSNLRKEKKESTLVKKKGDPCQVGGRKPPPAYW